jgi:CGNR zinc finger protein/putative stress-induced transcription regulator
MSVRVPQPVHDTDPSAPAPGDLELVRSFLSLHDHEPGAEVSLAPSPQSVGWWLRERGLLPRGAAASEDDLAWALEVHHALRSLVFENMGRRRDPRAIALLDAAAQETDLRISFRRDREPVRTSAPGVRGAVGRLLAIAFLAELQDDWRRLRECGSPTCTAIFYDRSKNHSARWCSMQTCGNRDKVRRFRARRASEARAP